MVIFFCFVCLLITTWKGGRRPVKNKINTSGVAWRGAGGKERMVCIDRISLKIKFNVMGIINSVSIQLAKIVFENLGSNEIKMKYDILSK